MPGAPLGLITTGVQALAGLLLPSASVFLLLLCNDREVLGPWLNRPWLNCFAGIIVSGLLLLSGILMATTMFPNLDIVSVSVCLCMIFAVCAGATFATLWWKARQRPRPPVLEQLSEVLARADRESWRMSPLALLEPVTWSVGTRVGMLALRGYLVIGAILLVVKLSSSEAPEPVRAVEVCGSRYRRGNAQCQAASSTLVGTSARGKESRVMQTLTIAEFSLRLGVGVGCGALIGIERQWQARRAGLRTNALVATGATLFVLYAVGHQRQQPHQGGVLRRLRSRLPRWWCHPARRIQRARAQHRGDIVVFGRGRRTRGRRASGVRRRSPPAPWWRFICWDVRWAT